MTTQLEYIDPFQSIMLAFCFLFLPFHYSKDHSCKINTPGGWS